MNTTALSSAAAPAVDPELTLLARFFAWLGVPAPHVSGAVHVRIARNEHGGLSLFPANDAARELLGGDEPAGNFATPADARKRATWNAWEVID